MLVNGEIPEGMITVRPDAAYLEHPEWHVLGKVVEDLNKQTFKDFELATTHSGAATNMTWQMMQNVADYIDFLKKEKGLEL